MTRARGRLAIVLHTHMPYVLGFGTWPFGEEWLWEALATSYVPLLGLLDRGAPVTLSLTPVLVRPARRAGRDGPLPRVPRRGPPARRTALDAEAARAAGDDDVARELERAAGDYARALERLPADLIAALRPHAAWTSAATHAMLPLLATDAAVRLQVRTGIAAHRARFGAWRGGFWLPECAHASWLDPLLEEAGVHAVVVDLTDVLGRGDARQLRPIATEGGPLLVPSTARRSSSCGATAATPPTPPTATPTAAPRTTTARGRTTAASTTRRAPRRRPARTGPTSSRASRRASRTAASRSARSTPSSSATGGTRGRCGSTAVLDAAAREGLEIVGLDDALADADPAAPLDIDRDDATTWGTPRDLATWSAPPATEFAWAARTAELRVAAAGAAVSDRALRELLALQSSDWAFLQTRAMAGEYPRERAAGHRAALEAALAGADDDGALAGLAPYLSRAAFLEP